MGNLTSLKVKMKPLEYGFCMALRNAQLQKAAAKSRKESVKLRKAFKATGCEPSPPLPDGIVEHHRLLELKSPKTEKETPIQFGGFMNEDSSTLPIAKLGY